MIGRISNIHDFKSNSINFFMHRLCLNEMGERERKRRSWGREKREWARRVG